MEKELIKKMTRFVELSRKFSKGIDDVIDEDWYDKDVYNHHLVSSGSATTWVTPADLSTLNKEEEEEPTRGERIFKLAYKRAKISDEYDEYLDLQSSLDLYFEGLENLKVL
jgi:hypothetical protein